MRQFDVCRLKTSPSDFVVVMQHALTSELDTLVVAPLSDAPFRKLVDRIRFSTMNEGQEFVLQIDRIAAIPKMALGEVVGNLNHERDRIARGLDLLFFGI